MFKNRKTAGEKLATELRKYNKKKNVIVLAIPRGGVEIGYEIAKQLGLQLDVLVIKKIGAPGNEEFAIGASSTDVYDLDKNVVLMYGISEQYITDQVKIKQKEAKDIYRQLRGNKNPLDVKGKVVILVDDGAATGSTMLLAIKILKKQSPLKIIVALPVAPSDSLFKLKQVTDEVICLLKANNFLAVGQFYEEFDQVNIDEVREYLSETT